MLKRQTFSSAKLFRRPRYMHLKYCTQKIYIQPKYHACTRNKNYVRTEEIQISNVNVIVLWQSLVLPFNQSQESLRRMAFNEEACWLLGTRRVQPSPPLCKSYFNSSVWRAIYEACWCWMWLLESTTNLLWTIRIICSYVINNCTWKTFFQNN